MREIFSTKFSLKRDSAGGKYVYSVKKNILAAAAAKLDRFKFLILDILNARRVSAELQLESQSELEPMGSSGIY